MLRKQGKGFVPIQNPLTMESPAPSWMLVKILATAPAVLMAEVIKLNWPVFLAYSNIQVYTFASNVQSSAIYIATYSK